jgi:hypothetical protein
MHTTYPSEQEQEQECTDALVAEIGPHAIIDRQLSGLLISMKRAAPSEPESPRIPIRRAENDTERAAEEYVM